MVMKYSEYIDSTKRYMLLMTIEREPPQETPSQLPEKTSSCLSDDLSSAMEYRQLYTFKSSFIMIVWDTFFYDLTIKINTH